MKSCTVQAPGTIANLVCGFDILGLCLEQPADKMVIRMIDEPKVLVKSVDGYPLPEDPQANTSGTPLLAMLQDISEPIGFEVLIHKNIKPGSGIGSSAAGAAGAVVGANHLLGNKFTKEELLHYAILGEQVASGVAHADNVAPCIFGGITLVRSVAPPDVVVLPAPPLYVAVVHPQIEIRTADARAVLRQEVPLTKAIRLGQYSRFGSGYPATGYRPYRPLPGRSYYRTRAQYTPARIRGYKKPKPGRRGHRWRHFRIRSFLLYALQG